MKPTPWQSIYVDEGRRDRRFYSKNLVPGFKVYGERLVSTQWGELREWDARRSKIGAALVKGLRNFPCENGTFVLYLGCASGTTVSHISDLVGSKGMVFAVDLAPRSLRDMVYVARDRKNIAPLLCDGNHVEEVAKRIVGVDMIIQDIAQHHQVMIFLKNMAFLKKGSLGYLCVKSRSINVAEAPKKVFADVRRELEKQVRVEEAVDLYPLEKDHMLFVCRKM